MEHQQVRSRSVDHEIVLPFTVVSQQSPQISSSPNPCSPSQCYAPSNILSSKIEPLSNYVPLPLVMSQCSEYQPAYWKGSDVTNTRPTSLNFKLNIESDDKTNNIIKNDITKEGVACYVNSLPLNNGNANQERESPNDPELMEILKDKNNNHQHTNGGMSYASRHNSNSNVNTKRASSNNKDNVDSDQKADSKKTFKINPHKSFSIESIMNRGNSCSRKDRMQLTNISDNIVSNRGLDLTNDDPDATYSVNRLKHITPKTFSHLDNGNDIVLMKCKSPCLDQTFDAKNNTLRSKNAPEHNLEKSISICEESVKSPKNNDISPPNTNINVIRPMPNDEHSPQQSSFSRLNYFPFPKESQRKDSLNSSIKNSRLEIIEPTTPPEPPFRQESQEKKTFLHKPTPVLPCFPSHPTHSPYSNFTSKSRDLLSHPLYSGLHIQSPVVTSNVIIYDSEPLIIDHPSVKTQYNDVFSMQRQSVIASNLNGFSFSPTKAYYTQGNEAIFDGKCTLLNSFNLGVNNQQLNLKAADFGHLKINNSIFSHEGKPFGLRTSLETISPSSNKTTVTRDFENEKDPSNFFVLGGNVSDSMIYSSPTNQNNHKPINEKNENVESPMKSSKPESCGRHGSSIHSTHGVVNPLTLKQIAIYNGKSPDETLKVSPLSMSTCECVCAF